MLMTDIGRTSETEREQGQRWEALSELDTWLQTKLRWRVHPTSPRSGPRSRNCETSSADLPSSKGGQASQAKA